MSSSKHWTNASVLGLGAPDPVEEVTRRAREVVAGALDSGWRGPPFDPMALAEHLGIAMTPSDDVRDARTVAAGDSGRLSIEFNPNRPPARVRFSIAHEIAHSLFPDCSAFVRNRAQYHELTADGWQLESLCNVAAAEFLMPAGSLPSFDVTSINTELLVEWRRKFDVSMEALLLRVIRLATSPCAAFCASSNSRRLGEDTQAHSIDYIVASPNWSVRSSQGTSLPKGSVVADCEAVGFTGSREEVWDKLGPIHVDCIGIPPYPGSVRPRVVGLVRPSGDVSVQSDSKFRTVRGDATKPRGPGLKIIAHVVNDATPNWGGGGFAAALRLRHPAAQAAFREWVAGDRKNLLLGQLHLAAVATDTEVATLVAQRGYGPSVQSRLRYSALQRSLRALGLRALATGATVHMPRIGAGQAGGSWDVVEGLVREHLCAMGVPVTVYDLPGAELPKPAQGLLPI